MERNNWGDNYTTILVVAGGERLSIAPNTPVFMAQRPNGYVYFNTLPNKFFRLVDFNWQGPVYNTVVTTNQTAVTTQNNNGKSKEKTKRKGGLLGAAVGTMVAGPIGLAVGYAATSKKVTKGKTKGTSQAITRNQAITNQNQVEVDSIAKIELADIESGQTFSIGIRCNSHIDIELDGFTWPDAPTQIESQNVPLLSEAEKINIIKEYKALLDSGVITVEEFENKKKEMLSNQLALRK